MTRAEAQCSRDRGAIGAGGKICVAIRSYQPCASGKSLGGSMRVGAACACSEWVEGSLVEAVEDGAWEETRKRGREEGE
jgi:hypothetical protein